MIDPYSTQPIEEQKKQGAGGDPDEPEKDINDELTIESMFKVFDKDAGTFMDVREIMDFNEDDFKDNVQVQSILKMMNESNPIPELPSMMTPAGGDPTLEMSIPMNYYVTNTKLSSFPLQSRLDGTADHDNLKSMAIINNRMT